MRIYRFLLSLMFAVFIFRFCGFVSCASNEYQGVIFGDSSTAIEFSDLTAFDWYYNFSYVKCSVDRVSGDVISSGSDIVSLVGINDIVRERVAIYLDREPVYNYIKNGTGNASTIYRYYYYDGIRVTSRSCNNQSVANNYWAHGNFSQCDLYVDRSCNIPVFLDYSAMEDWLIRGVLHDTLNVIDYGYVAPEVPDGSSLGFLTGVKYFVDSAAYQYDPNNTPEFISWGQYSTTGLDLSSDAFKVEFALEDNSSYYVNRKSDYVSEYGYNPIGNLGEWALELRDYVGGLVFPSGSNARAILQGRALNTGFNGKLISAGLVSASSRKHRLSAVSRYLNGLSNDDLEEASFRNFLQGYSDNPSNGYMGAMAQNISQLGRVYSLSYNIYARIVDTASGTYGDWLKIDRHNVPYWDGDSEDVLNGKITLTNGYRISPRSYVGDTFNNYIVENPESPKNPISLPTGFYNFDLDIGIPIYNNFRYINNDFNNGDVNNYTYINDNGDEVSGGSDINNTLDMLGKLSLVWNWYQQLFGGLFPDWALACIPVFSSMFVAVLIYKFGVGLLPW